MDTALQNQSARRLAAGWLLLALAALGLAALCAILLVAARSPLFGGFAAPRDLFRSALVLHVGFAVVVWFLAAAAGLWTLAAGNSSRWRWTALLLAACGAVAMAMAPWFGTPTPVLSNYIPVLDSPLFLAGLSAFMAGIAIAGMASLANILRKLRSPLIQDQNDRIWHWGALLSIVAVAATLGSFAAYLGAAGVPTTAAQFEMLLWGPGHLLQFVHILLLMTVWILLGEHALGNAIAPRGWLVGLLWVAALPIVVAPGIHLFYSVNNPGFRHAYTLLMSWGAWPAAALLGIGLLVRLVRAPRTVWQKIQTLPLALSILLFLLGCIFGAAIRGETTLIPAHYHGTVGAITLAYMAFGYYLLPLFGITAGTGRLMRGQPALYGFGLVILASSLAWAGWLGVPRKTMHMEISAQTPAYFAAMGLAGVGGLLAITGVALFVFNMVRSIYLRHQRGII
ncbi:MAG: cbb3-type cytochrome c oxidase subunit I [Gallionellaceae bacterium]|nr:cbb3-type cytochrome c oxidase subunit I [Gallionellaceae bacterium]